MERALTQKSNPTARALRLSADLMEQVGVTGSIEPTAQDREEARATVARITADGSTSPAAVGRYDAELDLLLIGWELGNGESVMMSLRRMLALRDALREASAARLAELNAEYGIVTPLAVAA